MKRIHQKNGVRHNAFTLIELLVVIAVIALLMAILVPALSSARELAQNTVCMANLRGLTSALSVYVVDNDDRLPAYHQLLPGQWNSGTLTVGSQSYRPIERSVLSNYIGYDFQDFTCPVFARHVNQDLIPPEGLAFSYTYNWNLCWKSEQDYKDQCEGLTKTSKVRRPGDMGVFCEENWYTHPSYASDAMNDGRIVVIRWPDQDTFATFHRRRKSDRYVNGNPPYAGHDPMMTGNANISFLDGHVAAVDTTETEEVLYDDDRHVKYRTNGSGSAEAE